MKHLIKVTSPKPDATQMTVQGLRENWLLLTEEMIDFVIKAELKGIECIPVECNTEAYELLKVDHDKDLYRGLSYIDMSMKSLEVHGSHSEIASLIRKKSLDNKVWSYTKYPLPIVTERQTSSWLKTVTGHLGPVLYPNKYKLDNFTEGLYTTEYREDYGFKKIEYSPTKVRRRKNQFKYYKRSRMRKGNMPYHVPHALYCNVAQWLWSQGFGGYITGSGSTAGAISAFVKQYDGLDSLHLLPAIRSQLKNWYPAVEDASHYVVGIKENMQDSPSLISFARHIESECGCLGIDIPSYPKGQKHDK